MKNKITCVKQLKDKKLYSFDETFDVGTILKIGENFSTIKTKHGNMYEMEDIGEEFLKNKGDIYEIVSLPYINENVVSNYWDGYEVVYAVEYCIGEVGSLRWYTKGLYKSEDKAVIQKDNMLNEIFSLKEKYLNKFKKEVNEDFNLNYQKLSKDEYNFILKNSNVRIANVVVTPHRIEDSKI